MKLYITLLALIASILSANSQKLVHYDLTISDTIVNYTGKSRMAIAVNGQIPMPTLRFTEGDTAEVVVHNKMHHETSIHWHGLLVPNEQDGVSYLTTAPIKPHSSHTFRFPIRQNGTYWYHSHTMTQAQEGMYGAIVIKKPDEKPQNEEIVLLSDWTDTDGMEVERRLHTANDWASIKKGAVQSYAEAIRAGKLTTKVANEWKRMNAMDVSDVYYDKFMVNGRDQETFGNYKAGDKIKIRLINGSASTYFWVSYAGGKIKVLATDGVDTEPVEVDRLMVATAETYDIEITVPSGGHSYQLLATAEDRSGSTSAWIGSGSKIAATPLKKLKYFEGMKMMNDMMTMNGNMKEMGMKMQFQNMDMNSVMYPEAESSPTMHMSDHNMQSSDHANMEHKNMKQGDISDNSMPGMEHSSMHNSKLTTLNYGMLKSKTKTTLPDKPFRTLYFELNGNMDRYVWTINNKTVSESDKILIKKGENIRFIIKNNSMMRHPMHLHGHYFRIMNEQGEYSPLKNTLDVMPMETDTIELNASEEYGDWFFHCHILYHMMAGMGRILSYEDSPANPQLPDRQAALKKLYADDRRYFLSADNNFMFNGNKGQFDYSNTRWAIQGEWRSGYKLQYGQELEARIGKYIGRQQWILPYVGVSWHYSKDEDDHRNMFGQRTDNHRIVAVAGLRYKLPMLFWADARINMYGRVRLQLEREDIPLTSRLRMNLMANTDKEYEAGLSYVLSPYFSLAASYNSDMKWGAGIKINY